MTIQNIKKSLSSFQNINLAKMLLRKIAINKLLMQRVLSMQTKSYCTSKKDTTELIMFGSNSSISKAIPIVPMVIAKNPPIEKLTRARVFDAKSETYRIQTINYCTSKKDPPEPIIPGSTSTTSESVPVAPKVIAKNPPIEKLTRGRVFDAKSETYRISPTSEHLNASVASPNKCPDDKKIIPTEKTTPSTPTTSTTVVGNKDEKIIPPPPGGGGGAGAAGPTAIPRLIRVEPERVMFCLIPYSWVKAFNTKTGVTGFWTFVFTYGTYLLSKEKIVMEHEYYGGLSMLVLCCCMVKWIGPGIALGLDKSIDEYEENFNQGRVMEKQSFEDSILHEETLQLSSAEQLVLVLAKRENVDLQLEAEYRARLMMVYKRVKDMLDYQVAYDLVQRRFAQDQMVRWTLEKVHQAITDDIDSKYVDMCLDQLDQLSQKAIKV